MAWNPKLHPRVPGTAFTEEIPEGIRNNQDDHRQPYPGDHGIRWESNGRPYPNTPSR